MSKLLETILKGTGCAGAVIAAPILATEGLLMYGSSFAKRHKIVTGAALVAGSIYLFNTNACTKSRQYIDTKVQTYLQNRTIESENNIKVQLEIERKKAEELAATQIKTIQERNNLEAIANNSSTQVQQTTEQLEATKKQLAQVEYDKAQLKNEYERLKNQPPQVKTVYVPQPTQETRQPRAWVLPSPRPAHRVSLQNTQIPSAVQPHAVDNNDGCYAHHIIQPGETLNAIASRYYSNADNQTWRVIQQRSMQFENYFEDDRRIPVGSIAHIPK